MKTRCSNPRASNFAYYGGRGITFDPAWLSFEQFLADMGEAPPAMWLDRIDSNGSYAKANCRWATVLEQQNNKRSNRIVSFRGEQMTLSQLSMMTGVGIGTLWSRLERGYDIERAVNQKMRKQAGHCVNGHPYDGPSRGGCRTCRLAREEGRRRERGARELSPPTCPNGHLFTPETTKLNNGWRQCRVCAREYMRAYTARKRDEAAIHAQEKEEA